MALHHFDQPGLDVFSQLSRPRQQQQPGPFGPATARAAAPTFETTGDRMAAMERRISDLESEVRDLKGVRTANSPCG